MKFILVGNNEGKSGEWGGYQFEKGVCIIPNSEVDNARRILSRYYSAYPETEVMKIDEKYTHISSIKQNQLEDNNSAQVEKEPGLKDEGNSKKPLTGEDSAKVMNQNILDAVNSLEDNDDSCWTQGGLPAVSAIITLTGYNWITRSHISDVSDRKRVEEKE